VATSTLVVAAVSAVIVFFPAEGSVLTPLHDAFDLLLGHLAFIVPLSLALAGTLGLALRSRPDLRLPRRRLAGLGLITLSLLPGDHLLGMSTGVVGDWFTGFMLDLLGEPLAALLVVGLVSAGIALTFDVRKRAVAAR
jgi:hypothetical protein